jgi:hypothetical protein
MGGNEELMPHLAVVCLEYLQKSALKGGMHAKIGFLQEKQAAWFGFGDDGIGADDQALHAIAQIINGIFLVSANLDVNYIVISFHDRYQDRADSKSVTSVLAGAVSMG